MAMGLFFGYLGMGDAIFDLLVQRTYSVMSNDVLISVPLFVFMGYIIERANILDRLFRSLQMASGNIPGSLAVATLATCALFATATGIVGAVVTLMGLLALPPMLRAGYDVKLRHRRDRRGRLPRHPDPALHHADPLRRDGGRLRGAALRRGLHPGVMLASLYILYAMGIALVKPSVAPRLPPEEVQVPFATILCPCSPPSSPSPR
jgi:TRAP-type mannitol/chloroaromatic compound transport system permease large subunit